MAGRMLWHDTRLAGRAPGLAPNTYMVKGDVAITHAVGWIAHYARTQGGLDELIVMCHGFEAHYSIGQQMSTQQAYGGFGLQICKEGIDISNVAVVGAWNPTPGGPLIRKITIYACGTAETGPGNENTIGDGVRFMGEFALHSGAYVVAGTQPQAYNPESVRPSNPAPIDFGEWEGPVFMFDPNTGRGLPYTPGRMA